MNLFAPVSKYMTDQKNLVVVNPDTPLTEVKDIFEKYSFHHLPVVHFHDIVGIISKLDYEHFSGGLNYNMYELEKIKASDIMTKGLAKVSSDTRMNVVIELFTYNRFHALPIVDEDELIGIITPFDILKAIGEEKPADPSMVYEEA
jgi:acetoin utilization protein AcuB